MQKYANSDDPPICCGVVETEFAATRKKGQASLLRDALRKSFTREHFDKLGFVMREVWEPFVTCFLTEVRCDGRF